MRLQVMMLSTFKDFFNTHRGSDFPRSCVYLSRSCEFLGSSKLFCGAKVL